MCLVDAPACLVGMGTAVFLPLWFQADGSSAMVFGASCCVSKGLSISFLSYRVRIGPFQVY